MATKDRSTWPGWARALTTGWVLSPIIVIALLAVTFEGYGYYTRHQQTTYSRGGAFGGSDGVTVAQSGPSSTKSGHRAGGKKGAAVKNGGKHVSSLKGGGFSNGPGGPGGPSGGSDPIPTASSSRHQSSSGAGHTTTPRPKAAHTATPLVTPPTGVYTLAVSGSESAKFGPISPCNNKFPSRATLDVHHASGESPTSYDFDMRLYPGSPNRHDERHIYRYSKSGVAQTYEESTVTCAGIKQSSIVGYAPPQTRVELPLAVGDSWHNHGGGSSRTETGTSNVVKETSLSVGGTRYQVYEIVTKLAMTGSETGERDQTWWYAPALGMPLKFSESLHGQRSGASYTESYTATVVRMP
jgi:hypothetical protein